MFIGYYDYDPSLIDHSLPADSAILVGYSPLTLLTLMVVSIILAPIPPVWSLLVWLPPTIAIPGCTPLALSADCHISSLSCAAKMTGDCDDIASPAPLAFSLQKFGKRSLGRHAKYELLEEDHRESSIDDVEFDKRDDSHLERAAQSKLSWGAIHMPQEWYAQHGYDPASVGHLGFGIVEDGEDK